MYPNCLQSPLYMQDKSSRADSDIAGGIRNGCFLGHPSLDLDLGLGSPAKTGRN